MSILIGAERLSTNNMVVDLRRRMIVLIKELIATKLVIVIMLRVVSSDRIPQCFSSSLRKPSCSTSLLWSSAKVIDVSLDSMATDISLKSKLRLRSTLLVRSLSSIGTLMMASSSLIIWTICIYSDRF